MEEWENEPSQRGRREMEGKKEGGQARRTTDRNREISGGGVEDRKQLIVAARREHGERRPLLARTRLTAR